MPPPASSTIAANALLLPNACDLLLHHVYYEILLPSHFPPPSLCKKFLPLQSCIFVCVVLTEHPLRRQHPQHVRCRVVLHGDPVDVLGRETQDGIALHLEGTVLEGPHGVDPGLLRGVDEAGVYPARHAVELQITRMYQGMKVSSCSIIHEAGCDRPLRGGLGKIAGLI